MHVTKAGVLRLTHLSACAGCASKVDASFLAQILRELPPIADPNVLVGHSSADDAGVYLLDDERALVQTVDFFTPIVDDPYDYGRIAATNALSDVYAMGASPLCALAIAAFPEDLDSSVIAAILRGGVDVAAAAGIAIVGGHTIKDDEPKYGLAVTGIVHPDRILRNDTGRRDDVLILTKPLGTGILTTARRSDEIDEATLAPAIESMVTLNRAASEVALRFAVHAMTDVTGFGLLGHLREMLGGRLGARIDGASVPLLPNALALASRDIVPGGTRKNLASALDNGARFDAQLSAGLAAVLCDAQTSGGLLIGVDGEQAAPLLDALHEAGARNARIIGAFTESGHIEVA
jgi:selenide, water dikinase